MIGLSKWSPISAKSSTYLIFDLSIGLLSPKNNLQANITFSLPERLPWNTPPIPTGQLIEQFLYTFPESGYSIPPNYDSMIAKIISTAQTREEAITKMKRALDEFIIEGIKTTIPFHRKLMDDPAYNSGVYTTKFMEDFSMED